MNIDNFPFDKFIDFAHDPKHLLEELVYHILIKTIEYRQVYPEEQSLLRKVVEVYVELKILTQKDTEEFPWKSVDDIPPRNEYIPKNYINQPNPPVTK